MLQYKINALKNIAHIVREMLGSLALDATANDSGVVYISCFN